MSKEAPRAQPGARHHELPRLKKRFFVAPSRDPNKVTQWNDPKTRAKDSHAFHRVAASCAVFHRGCWNDYRRAPTRSAALRPVHGRVHVLGTTITWAFEQPLAPPSVNAYHRPAPWQLSVMRTSVALPPPQAGKVSVMRRRSKPHTFDEWLNAEKTRIEAVLKSAGQGPQRDLLELKLRQIENALHIDGWLSSAVRHP